VEYTPWKRPKLRRDEYNEISNFCKEKMEPVFLTKNGEGDLVVMSIEAYTYREEMLDLREKLLDAEMQRINGAKTECLWGRRYSND